MITLPTLQPNKDQPSYHITFINSSLFLSLCLSMFNVLLHLSVTSVEAAPEKAGCDKITTMERSDMKEKDSSSSQTVKKDMGCMERNRREKMTEYFSTLQSIVPNLFPKVSSTSLYLLLHLSLSLFLFLLLFLH